MRAVRLVVVAGVAAAAIVSASRPASISPAVYLDRALSLMQHNDLASPSVDWRVVSRRAHAMAAGARTTEETYPAILYALGRLNAAGDRHASFANPLIVKLRTTAPDLTATPPPTVSLYTHRVGMIALQAVTSGPTSANSRRYATAALAAMRKLQATAHPCGWIVDLTADLGGTIVPMVFSVGPLLGEGRLAGYSGPHGFAFWTTLRGRMLVQHGYMAEAPASVAPITPAPPVAVVYGSGTASAGEWVAVAFRGRPNTHSFGTPTGGYTNAPLVFGLPDGAELLLATLWYVDRTGVVYRRALQPDTPTSVGDALVVAARWLLAQPACTRS